MWHTPVISAIGSRVQGQPGLRSQTLPPKKKKEEEEESITILRL
jgi:hypothetical protein